MRLSHTEHCGGIIVESPLLDTFLTDPLVCKMQIKGSLNRNANYTKVLDRVIGKKRLDGLHGLEINPCVWEALISKYAKDGVVIKYVTEVFVQLPGETSPQNLLTPGALYDIGRPERVQDLRTALATWMRDNDFHADIQTVECDGKSTDCVGDPIYCQLNLMLSDLPIGMIPWSIVVRDSQQKSITIPFRGILPFVNPEEVSTALVSFDNISVAMAIGVPTKAISNTVVNSIYLNSEGGDVYQWNGQFWQYLNHYTIGNGPPQVEGAEIFDTYYDEDAELIFIWNGQSWCDNVFDAMSGVDVSQFYECRGGIPVTGLANGSPSTVGFVNNLLGTGSFLSETRSLLYPSAAEATYICELTPGNFFDKSPDGFGFYIDKATEELYQYNSSLPGLWIVYGFGSFEMGSGLPGVVVVGPYLNAQTYLDIDTGLFYIYRSDPLIADWVAIGVDCELGASPEVVANPGSKVYLCPFGLGYSVNLTGHSHYVNLDTNEVWYWSVGANDFVKAPQMLYYSSGPPAYVVPGFVYDMVNGVLYDYHVSGSLDAPTLLLRPIGNIACDNNPGTAIVVSAMAPDMMACYGDELPDGVMGEVFVSIVDHKLYRHNGLEWLEEYELVLGEGVPSGYSTIKYFFDILSGSLYEFIGTARKPQWRISIHLRECDNMGIQTEVSNICFGIGAVPPILAPETGDRYIDMETDIVYTFSVVWVETGLLARDDMKPSYVPSEIGQLHLDTKTWAFYEWTGKIWEPIEIQACEFRFYKGNQWVPLFMPTASVDTSFYYHELATDEYFEYNAGWTELLNIQFSQSAPGKTISNVGDIWIQKGGAFDQVWVYSANLNWVNMGPPIVIGSDDFQTRAIPSECGCDDVIFYNDSLPVNACEIGLDLGILGARLNKNFFGGKLESGVYSIEIRLFYCNGDQDVDSGCVFVDCCLKCLLAECMVKDPNIELHYMYEALAAVGQCEQCDCSMIIALYEQLLGLLKGCTKKVSGCTSC